MLYPKLIFIIPIGCFPDRFSGDFEQFASLTDADFNGVLKKAFAEMWDYEQEKYRALCALLKAWEKRDKLAIVQARKHVEQAHQRMINSDKKLGCCPAQEDNVEFGRILIQLFGLPPGQEKEAIRRYCGYSHGPHAEADPRWLLSQLLSEGLRSVRLVFWWNKKNFRPAFYSADLKSAVYLFTLMKIKSGRGWGVCPHCGEFFAKKRPDQDYCSIAHRESHRMARWREKKRSATRASARSRNSRS